MNKTFVAAALALITNQAVAGDKCYALALSSAGETGSFQAGVLKGLLNAGVDIQYDAISGVSGGAVNASILASFAKGQESAAVARLYKFWQDAGNAKLSQDWWGGVVTGLLSEPGLYDETPMKAFLTTELADIGAMQRFINVCLTDVLKGVDHDLRQSDLSNKDNLIEALYASFAWAGYFPPVSAFGSDFFDGSSIMDLDAFSPIAECLKTHAPQDVIVDAILTSEKTLKQVDATNYGAFDIMWRYLSISRYYSNMDGLLRAQFAYPGVQWRYIVAPTESLPDNLFPLVSYAV